MAISRNIGCLASAVFLLGAISGCQAIDGHRTLMVQVRDAETGQPIKDVSTRVSYPLAEGLLQPGDSYGRTDRDGLFPMPASAFTSSNPLLEVHAEGYLPEHRFVTAEQVRATRPASWFETVEQRPPTVVVEMYPDNPLPIIELVIPDNRRGAVQVELKVPESAENVPGQRKFSFAVPDSGQVVVTGPAILGKFPVPSFTARYADGTPIPREYQANGDTIGLWAIQYEARKFTFLIGTRADFTQYRMRFPGDTPHMAPPPADPSARRGGHGRGRPGGAGPGSSAG
jgi:hypothetical protein